MSDNLFLFFTFYYSRDECWLGKRGGGGGYEDIDGGVGGS